MAEENPAFSYMENLPPEIREKILSYLKYAEIARLRSVNRHLNRTCIAILNRGFEQVKANLDKRCTYCFEAIVKSTTSPYKNLDTLIRNRLCCIHILKLFRAFQIHYLRYMYLKRTENEEPQFVFIHGNTLDLFHSTISAGWDSLSKFPCAVTSLLVKCLSQIERVISACDRPLTPEEKEELKSRIDECKLDERHDKNPVEEASMQLYHIANYGFCVN